MSTTMSDFKIEKVLGRGSFGSVYLVTRKQDNKIFMDIINYASVIERIKTMEEHLNKASQAVKALSDALDLYAEAMESIETIDDYLVSDEWQQDFDDSEAGRLPKDLKCGVLSEDGIWNVIDTSRELNCQMLELVATHLRNE